MAALAPGMKDMPVRAMSVQLPWPVVILMPASMPKASMPAPAATGPAIGARIGIMASMPAIEEICLRTADRVCRMSMWSATQSQAFSQRWPSQDGGSAKRIAVARSMASAQAFIAWVCWPRSWSAADRVAA